MGDETSSGAGRTLHASRRKWLGLAAASVAFVAIGVLLLRDGRAIAWFPIVFFGLCAALAVVQLVRPAKLVVGATTIDVVASIGRTTTYRLCDCSEFRVWRVPMTRNRLVVFDHAGSASTRSARANRSLAGGNASLPDTFGLPAEELAALLNDARVAAASARDI